MKIAHIFNEVKPKDKTKVYKDEFIDTQPFDIRYFRDYTFSDYEDNAVDNDFSKKYYHALSPIEDRSIVSKYDEEKLRGLVEELGDDLLLISGDFWGIQKFIFDGLTTSKASKILRSRSAMVQLITYAVVERIKEVFKGSEALLFGAGKFMILAKNEESEKLKVIQKELDSYFLENFFGQNGFILSSQPTKAERLLNQKDSMKDDLDALGADNDSKKLNKFDLLNVEDDAILIDPFKEAEINDNNSCKFCNKRIVDSELEEDACPICFNQINLGKKLTTHDYINIIGFGRLSRHKKIDKNLIEIIKLGKKSYYARFSKSSKHFSWGKTFDISTKPYDKETDKWSLNSYVPKDKENKILDFSSLAEGSSGLMALKADIDKLGDTFREFYKEDFRKFNRLSREVEFFFSDYITSLLEDKKVYTVFAGGDDLFLIGEYREIVDLAKEIRDEFYNFSLNKTTISMGLVMFKPSTPITFVSDMADKAEKRAKAVLRDEDKQKTKEEISKYGLDRDGIDIFGVSMKYDEFIAIEKDFKEVTDFLEKERDDKTALYYRLIELCDMRENIKNDIRNAMWKSKLNYLFRRNVKREDNDSRIFTKLSNLIEKGEKFKPSIFLKIYNNRDKEKNSEKIG